MQFDTRSLWIYIHFPQLQLNVIEQDHADFALEEPRCIYETQQNRISQINQAAAKRGIKRGMGLAKASMLYPDLRLHEYRSQIEHNSLEQLANSLYLLSSDIVIEPPKGIILRAQNMLKLYEGLPNYWQCIKQCLMSHSYKFSSACGFSIQGAKLMAKQGLGIISDERSAIEVQLMRCELAFSDIHLKDLEKLRRIGIQNMAQLSALPLSDLANRLTRFSLDIISELRGQSPSKVEFFKPALRYQDYIELLYEISVTDKLMPVIEHALNKLSDFLYVRNAHCLHIEIAFFQREHDALHVGFDSAMPIYQSKDWLTIIALRLERIRFTSPVYAIKLICDKHEIASGGHDDFFARKSTHVAAMSLLSRLSSKLGTSKQGQNQREKVTRLQYVDDFRPERVSQAVQQAPSAQSKMNTRIFEDRPGILLPQPSLLQEKVELIKGPERIVSGWWDDNQVCRDYYIGQSKEGQQVWVFRTPEQKWFLHGYFV